MKTTFKVVWNELSVVALFVSEDEVRYCLNGVFFDIKKDQLVMVGTDGRRIAMVRSSHAHDAEPCEFILPREALKRLVRRTEPCDESEPMSVPLPEDLITVTYDSDAKTIGLQAERDDFTITCPALDANYPNYLAIIPQDEPTPQPFIFINPEFFNDYLKAANILGKGGLIFQCHNDSLDKSSAFPVVVTIPGAAQFFSVCMTIREGNTAPTPHWLQKKKEAS